MVFHQEWLRHPTTQQLLRILDKQEERIVNFIAKNAMEMVAVSNEQMRHNIIQLKEVRQLKQTINDSNIFVARISA